MNDNQVTFEPKWSGMVRLFFVLSISINNLFHRYTFTINTKLNFFEQIYIYIINGCHQSLSSWVKFLESTYKILFTNINKIIYGKLFYGGN